MITDLKHFTMLAAATMEGIYSYYPGKPEPRRRFSSEPKAPGQRKKAKARRRLTKASKRANR